MSLQTIPPPQTAEETKTIHPNSLDAEVNKYFGMYGNTLMHVSWLSRDLQTAASSSCALIHQNTVLLAHRAQEPQKDKLVIPGGFVEENESLEQAAVREVWEEVGVNVDPRNFQYIASFPNTYNFAGNDYKTVDPFFACILPEKVSTILQQDEVSASVWVPLDENFDQNEIAFDSHRKTYQILLTHFGSKHSTLSPTAQQKLHTWIEQHFHFLQNPSNPLLHENALENYPLFKLDGKKLIYTPTHFSRYLNTGAAVATVLVSGEDILIPKDTATPHFVDGDESYEEASQREIQRKFDINTDAIWFQYIKSTPSVYRHEGHDYKIVTSLYVYQIDPDTAESLKKEGSVMVI